MKRAKRILLIATILLVCVSSAQASLFRHRKAAAPQPPPAVASALSLTAIEADGSRVTLRTSGTPAYTSYSPSPDVFVVDIASATKGPGLSAPAALPAGVASVSAEEAVEMGTGLTRVTFRMAQPLALQASASGDSIVVAIPPVTPPPAAVEVAKAEVPRIEPVVEPQVQVATVAPKPATPPVPTQKARNLRRIETSGSGSQLEIRISGDGSLAYKSFRLENPSRLVIDLPGVTNRVPQPSLSVDGAVVKRVRAGQFKSAPDPVARIVVDLASKSEFAIAEEGDHLRVSFGNAAQSVAVAPQGPTAVPETKTVNIVAEKPAHVATASADVTAQVPVIPPDASWKMPEAKSVINARAEQAAPPEVKKKSTTLGPTGQSAQSPAVTSGENVFTDTTQPAEPPKTGGQVISGGGTGAGRTLSGGERVYTGEPISLDLVGADLKDVLRTFAELTGLNISVDPGVSGSVTGRFTDVPWDQVLDLILRQNGLQYVLEGNVMRVGKVETLAAETASTRRLAEEKRLNVPLVTVIFKLSYARASEVAALLQQLASPRARMIVDQRTNQLIVSEIPDYLQTLNNLIQTVDIPTKQVAIEARIVEASKTFLQQYGFNWGFSGALDPATGTGTGLIFPNRVGFTGGPFDFGPGNPVLSFNLTNVLGTFNLDFALNATESEGITKIISAPRVTTQDNQAASIESGVQIPYQTRVNFTTTISYLSATLRLNVTPQITEAGTVIMDIEVSKNEPLSGSAIEGSAGAPISTRSARTRLMIRDGGTAVIGGIYQVKDSNAQTRMPFVHQIPVLGNLFKTHRIDSSHDELLIFITPRIIRGA